MPLTRDDLIELRDELQRQVLGESVEENPRLGGIRAFNEELLEIAPMPVEMFNYLYEQIKNAIDSVGGFTNRFNNAIGTELSGQDRTIFNELRETLGKNNIIQFIDVLNTKINDISIDINPEDLTGDILKAQQLNANPQFVNIVSIEKNDDETDENFNKRKADAERMTINQYADRQPKAWTNTKIKFDKEIDDKLIFGNKKYDGTYFIL